MRLRWIENHDVVEAFCYDVSGRLWRVQVMSNFLNEPEPAWIWVANLANSQDHVIRMAFQKRTSEYAAKWDAEQFLASLGFKENDELSRTWLCTP